MPEHTAQESPSRRLRDSESAPSGTQNGPVDARSKGDSAPPGRKLISTSVRQESNRLCLVDVMGGGGDLQSLRVKPAVFIKLLERVEYPLVAHHKRRWGIHSYFAYCGGFIIETSSRRALSFPGRTRQVQRSQPLPSRKATSYYPGGMTAPDGGAERQAEPRRKKTRLTEFFTEDNYYVTEWWNTPDDPALSVARLRIQPGVSIRPYRLRGVTERYLFLSGRGLVEVDGHNREVGPGDGILVKAGSWRCITNMGERDLGLLSICRPRFERLEHASD